MPHFGEHRHSSRRGWAPAPVQSAERSDPILQRRSAVAFDGHSSIDPERSSTMLSAAMPDAGVPLDALWWTPRIHLALFVHRVTGVEPGLYMLVRDDVGARRAAGRRRARVPLGAHGRQAAAVSAGARRLPASRRRVSCDQDIAADGFFSLGMLARLRRQPRRVRSFVLPPSVLGERRRRADALSGGRSGGCARDRHRLLLRRSGARRARPQRTTRFKACITSRSACRWRMRG